MAAARVAAALAAVESADAAGDVVALSRLLEAHAADVRVAEKAVTALFFLADRQLEPTPRSGFPNLSLPERRTLVRGCSHALRANADGKKELLARAFTIIAHTLISEDGILPAAERSLVAADSVPSCVAALRHNNRDFGVLFVGCSTLSEMARGHYGWPDTAVVVGLVRELKEAVRLSALDLNANSASPQAPALRKFPRVVFGLLGEIFEAAGGRSAALRAEAAGTMAAAAAAMRAAPGDELLQQNCCSALHRLANAVASDVDAHPSDTILANVYEAAVAALTAHLHGLDSTVVSALQSITLTCRMWLRFGHASTQVDQVGVAGAVQTALTSRLGSYKVVLASFGTLTMFGLRLGKRPPRGVDMRQLVVAVLAGMRAHSHSGALLKQGATALLLLRGNTADGYHAFHELGGPDAVNAVFRDHPQYAEELRRVAASSEEFAMRPMCAWPECGAVRGGAAETTLQLCGACRQARYCSRACQTAHWPEHKAVCRAARAAQRADAGAADGSGGAA